jgi:type I restriction enzyme S subunit
VWAKLDRRQLVGLDPATAALFPNSFQDSEAGNIPKGWEVVKLKDLTSKIGSGATPRGGSEVYVEEGTALIRSQNVHDYEFRWTGLARLTDKSAEELKNVEVIKNDVLLNITGDSILRTCVVDPEALPARVNQHVAIIRAINSIPANYLHFCLAQESMKTLLIGMSTGATRHAITKGHLESVEVLKPSSPVLNAFDQHTSPWLTQIDANRSQSRTLATLRDTLLPKLLSGELKAEGLSA